MSINTDQSSEVTAEYLAGVLSIRIELVLLPAAARPALLLSLRPRLEVRVDLLLALSRQVALHPHALLLPLAWLAPQVRLHNIVKKVETTIS